MRNYFRSFSYFKYAWKSSSARASWIETILRINFSIATRFPRNVGICLSFSLSIFQSFNPSILQSFNPTFLQLPPRNVSTGRHGDGNLTQKAFHPSMKGSQITQMWRKCCWRLLLLMLSVLLVLLMLLLLLWVHEFLFNYYFNLTKC